MAGWLGADVWEVWSDDWSVDVFSTGTFSSRTPAAATRNRCAVFSSRSFSFSSFASLRGAAKLRSVVSRSAGILACSLEATGKATDLPSFGVSGAPADVTAVGLYTVANDDGKADGEGLSRAPNAVCAIQTATVS